MCCIKIVNPYLFTLIRVLESLLIQPKIVQDHRSDKETYIILFRSKNSSSMTLLVDADTPFSFNISFSSYPPSCNDGHRDC